MQIFKQLHTEEGRKRYQADMQAGTDDIIADLRAKKKANGGVSTLASDKRFRWKYTNSNFGMGL